MRVSFFAIVFNLIYFFYKMLNTYWYILDSLFVIVHTFIILFNLTGWIWRRSRTLHLISVLSTGASWLFLGLFYGLGYCPLTDWHYSVLNILGVYDMPTSYIQYLIKRLTNVDVSAQLIDNATLIGYLLVLILSVYFNFFFMRKCKK